jgi:hypothetical protein
VEEFPYALPLLQGGESDERCLLKGDEVFLREAPNCYQGMVVVKKVTMVASCQAANAQGPKCYDIISMHIEWAFWYLSHPYVK